MAGHSYAVMWRTGLYRCRPAKDDEPDHDACETLHGGKPATHEATHSSNEKGGLYS